MSLLYLYAQVLLCGVPASAGAFRATASAHPPQDVPLSAHVLGEESGPLAWVLQLQGIETSYAVLRGSK